MTTNGHRVSFYGNKKVLKPLNYTLKWVNFMTYKLYLNKAFNVQKEIKLL